MSRPERPSATERAVDADRGLGSAAPDLEPDELTGEGVAPSEPGLAALPIAGLTRRRVAAVVSGVFAAWLIIVFARQVSEAQAATARVETLAAGNAGLQMQVAVLKRELDLIGRQQYVAQQARGYGLGNPREIAFSLADDAPPLPPDAPGSAALRVGATSTHVSPLERWLTVLFGPSD